MHNNPILNRLRDLREDADKTQDEVAKELNVHTTTYARWEQNPMTMKFPTIIKIALYYNVTIDYIAGLTNRKTPLRQELTEEAKERLKELQSIKRNIALNSMDDKIKKH